MGILRRIGNWLNEEGLKEERLRADVAQDDDRRREAGRQIGTLLPEEVVTTAPWLPGQEFVLPLPGSFPAPLEGLVQLETDQQQ